MRKRLKRLNAKLNGKLSNLTKRYTGKKKKIGKKAA
jgi:hypothetical protein